MNNIIKARLMEMPTEQLVEIILAAINGMKQEPQLDFIARYIDARASLNKLGAGNPTAFIAEVDEFCRACLEGEYYADESEIEEYFSDHEYYGNYYDDEWDYDEYFCNAEWVDEFTRLFKLSMMYIRSGDAMTGYESNARLLSCLSIMSSDERFLGTDKPLDYLDIGWTELFELHFNAMFQCHTNPQSVTELAFRCWINFGSLCTDAFLCNVNNVEIAETLIFDRIGEINNWEDQRRCFKLLDDLYKRKNMVFDKAAKALMLVDNNIYFHYFVTEGYYEQSLWAEVVNAATTALPLFPLPEAETMERTQKYERMRVRTDTYTLLVDAYENLRDFDQAYDAARNMFFEELSLTLYKRARSLAEKSVGASAFLSTVEKALNESVSAYTRNELLQKIYSYEGEDKKLYTLALSEKTDSNYYGRKYIALSLVYRAVHNKSDIGSSLVEYLAEADGQEGIDDMLKLDIDDTRKTELLINGADLLRGIVIFHIAAAKRNRYAKAAFYMCVLRDIYTYLKRMDEFDNFFRDIISQNSRRPALLDEMRIVHGVDARRYRSL